MQPHWSLLRVQPSAWPFLFEFWNNIYIFLEGLHTGKKLVIWMMIPVKNNSNDEFLACVYAN